MPLSATERKNVLFDLAWILNEIMAALDYLIRERSALFPQAIHALATDQETWVIMRAKMVSAIDDIQHGKGIEWKKLEEVGLTDKLLDWKMNLFCLIVGRNRPTDGDRKKGLQIAKAGVTHQYPKGKPWYRRFFQLGKSIFASLMEGIKGDSRLRLILESIKEFMEGLEAAMKFLELGAGANEE